MPTLEEVLRNINQLQDVPQRPPQTTGEILTADRLPTTINAMTDVLNMVAGLRQQQRKKKGGEMVAKAREILTRTLAGDVPKQGEPIMIGENMVNPPDPGPLQVVTETPYEMGSPVTVKNWRGKDKTITQQGGLKGLMQKIYHPLATTGADPYAKDIATQANILAGMPQSEQRDRDIRALLGFPQTQEREAEMQFTLSEIAPIASELEKAGVGIDRAQLEAAVDPNTGKLSPAFSKYLLSKSAAIGSAAGRQAFGEFGRDTKRDIAARGGESFVKAWNYFSGRGEPLTADDYAAINLDPGARQNFRELLDNKARMDLEVFSRGMNLEDALAKKAFDYSTAVYNKMKNALTNPRLLPEVTEQTLQDIINKTDGKIGLSYKLQPGIANYLKEKLVPYVDGDKDVVLTEEVNQVLMDIAKDAAAEFANFSKQFYEREGSGASRKKTVTPVSPIPVSPLQPTVTTPPAQPAPAPWR